MPTRTVGIVISGQGKITMITLTTEEAAKAKDLNVAWMQKWLNSKGADLVVDGQGGSLTRAAIIQVFVNKNAQAITQEQLQSIARDLGDSSTNRINAVAKVESAGGGWFDSVIKTSCAARSDPVCSLPPPGAIWPAPDKNHLTWNKGKGCFEPLCPELNNQVLDKYKSCEEERILCDKDGNKVKVTVDGDTVKVTQAKYNQTAEIKNGKVQTVKKLTESQKEAEFK